MNLSQPTIAVNVQGFGIFQIPQDKIGNVISALERNKAVMIQNEQQKKPFNYQGAQLLNETHQYESESGGEYITGRESHY